MAGKGRETPKGSACSWHGNFTHLVVVMLDFCSRGRQIPWDMSRSWDGAVGPTSALVITASWFTGLSLLFQFKGQRKQKTKNCVHQTKASWSQDFPIYVHHKWRAGTRINHRDPVITSKVVKLSREKFLLWFFLSLLSFLRIISAFPSLRNLWKQGLMSADW